MHDYVELAHILVILHK